MSGAPLIIPFRYGLNEGEDPKAVPPGTLTRLLNGRIDKAGRIRKRYGTTGLVKTIAGLTSITKGVRLIPRGNATCVFDGEYLYEYADTKNAWNLVDKAPNLELSWSPLVSTSGDTKDASCAVSGDLCVYAYLTGGQLFVEIRSLSTGAIVMRPKRISPAGGGAGPRVFIRGTTALVVFLAAGTVIRVQEFDLSALTTGTLFSLAATPLNGGVFDAMPVGTDLYITYETATATVKLERYDSTYTQVGATVTVGTGGVSLNSIAISATAAEFVYVVYAVGAGATKLAVYDTSLTVVTAAASIAAGESTHVVVTRYDASTALVAFDAGTKITTELISSAGAVTATSIRSTVSTLVGSQFVQMQSRFYIGALVVVTQAFSTGTPFFTFLLLEVETTSGAAGTPHHVVGIYGPRYAGMNTPGNVPNTARNYVTQFSSDGTTGYAAIPFRTNPEEIWRVSQIAFDLVKVRPIDATSDCLRAVNLGPTTIAASGAPSSLDGFLASGAGFCTEPDVSLTTATTGGLMLAGTYNYVAVYEYVDANGVTHRSVPSTPRSITTTGTTSTVTLTLACTAAAGRQSPLTGLLSTSAARVRIAIYRTLAGGSDYYRLTHEPDANVVFNDPTANSVTLVDTRADGAITGTGAVVLSTRPQLYTTAGELADVAPSASLTITAHRGRAAMLAGDGRTLWFTKNYTENPLVSPGFNEALTITFAKPKSALVSLDDFLVALGSDTVELVEGDGTNAAGTNNGWSVRQVQTDVGCVTPRSVVRGPMGVFFLSRRGIELLDRGLQVTWIGRPIQDDLAAFPTITSAVLVADQHEIRWTCVSADGFTGIVIVFDYQNNAWLTRTYRDTSDTYTASAPFVDACLINGTWTALTAGGQVYRETNAHCLDGASTWVTLDVETAWIAPAGNIGWQRVQKFGLLGTAVSDHDLVISISRDFRTAVDQTETFTSTGAVTSPGPLEQVRIGHAVQKVQAVRYRITDATPSGGGSVSTGDGPILEGFALTVMNKEGFPRRSASKQAG